MHLRRQEGRNRINEGLALIRRIKDRYGFLEKHSRVLVGVSGGADSAVLLALLQEYNMRFTQQWYIHACHVNMNIPGYNADVKSLLELYKIPYTMLNTHIPRSALRKMSVCYVCSRHRRQKLLETAESMNIQQIALAHHKQDIAETLLLNMMYNGEISTILPKQLVIQGRHFFIRPLYSFEKKAIMTIASVCNLPIAKATCPHFKNSKRNIARNFLEHCEKNNPDIYKNIFRAVSHIKRAYLP